MRGEVLCEEIEIHFFDCGELVLRGRKGGGRYAVRKDYTREFCVFVAWRRVEPTSEDSPICCFEFDIAARHGL